MPFQRNNIVKTVVHRIKETLMRFRYYKFSFVRKNRKQIYVAVFDEKRLGYGLADRFKGMVSLYAFCKIKNVPFRCSFTYPFDLSKFMQPHGYNWQLSPDEKAVCASDVRVLVIQGEDSPWRLTGLHTKKQVHAYINRDYLPVFNKKYNTNFDWGTLFGELFKPSEALAQAVANHLEIINSPYVACQLRFMSLLGDFKEYSMPPLPVEAQQLLINRCTDAILDVKRHTDRKVLVTSDSVSFVNHIAAYEDIIAFPEKTVHIDCAGDAGDMAYMKPFVDFLLLSHAEKIYSIVAAGMHPSEFPIYAAKTGKVPFEKIKI